MSSSTIRNNWTHQEIAAIYKRPLLDLIFTAAQTHRKYHNPQEVQVCKLLSIKTGGCSEDCAYCPQAARYHTNVTASPLLQYNEVLDAAKQAQQSGASRFCMGAAWREVRDNAHFDRILDMVNGINSLGMEVCCTLGMLNESQAERLKAAGLYAYNHNIDSSEEFYSKIISTRTYSDRLKTLENVRNAGISVCCGGIVGMGETETDRIGMLFTLSNLPQHPESVPINALVSVDGTPLEQKQRIEIWAMIRTIASARIIMPTSIIRLSAGRNEMNMTEQALCFLAGANSIFAGDKLLTTPNPDWNFDSEMFDVLGLTQREAFKAELNATV